MKTPSGARRILGTTLVLLGTLMVAAAAVGWFIGPERYEALAVLSIDLPDEDLLFEGSSPPSLTAMTDYSRVQQKNLRSDSLLRAVVRKERLAEAGDWAQALDLVGQLRSRVKVRPVDPDTPALLEVCVSFEQPEKAASIANTLTDEFIDWMAARHNERSSSQLFFLRNQVSGLEGEVAKAEEDLHNYRMRTKCVTFEEDGNPIDLGLTRAQEDFLEASVRAQTAANLVALLEKHLADDKPAESFPAVASDPRLQQIEAELTRTALEQARRLRAPTADDPGPQQPEAQVEAVRALGKRVAGEVAERLRAEAEIARALEQQQTAWQEDWEARRMDWNRARMEYAVLERKAASKTALYERFLARVNELDILQKYRPNNHRVVDPAVPPESPVHPWRPPAVLLFVAGLLVGFTGVLFRTAGRAARLEDGVRAD